MDHNERQKRLRLLIKKHNKQRKRQSKKIDILCNDLIAAQREFIRRLDRIRFTANFYEAIVGASDFGGLFCTAAGLIKDEIPDANVAFFLRQSGGSPGGGDSFELHMFESNEPISLGKERPENCVSGELVEHICQSNKVCTLEDLFAMGLEGDLVGLNKLSVATIPMGQLGQSFGFILIYRSNEDKLRSGEINNVAAVAPGLSRAIRSCREFSQCCD